MSLRPTDPLLSIAKGITWFFLAIFLLVTASVTIAIPVILFKQSDVLAELAAEGVTAGGAFIAGLVFVLAGIAALMLLGAWFLRLLQFIIDSVREGDPFIPANADRLARMGWIALFGQIAAMPVGMVGAWIAGIGEQLGEDAQFSFNIGGGGILLILVLFILARVFRKGTEMRADLEGTV